MPDSIRKLIDNPEVLIMIIIILLMIGIVSWASQPIENYSSHVMSEIYPVIVKFFGDNFYYRNENQIFLSSLGYLGKELNNGYVEGRYKNASFELADTTIMENCDEPTKYLFIGVFILVVVDKKLMGKTIITIGKNKYKRSQDFKGLEEIEFKNKKLAKKIQVFSNNKEEAYSLLTDDLIKKIVELSYAFGSKNIQCSFYSNRILFEIPSNKNFFEISSIFEPITLVDDSNKFLAVMNKLFEFIDTVEHG